MVEEKREEEEEEGRGDKEREETLVGKHCLRKAIAGGKLTIAQLTRHDR